MDLSNFQRSLQVALRRSETLKIDRIYKINEMRKKIIPVYLVNPVYFLMIVESKIIRLIFHSQYPRQESPTVRNLFDDLRRGFARAVPGFGLDADQGWRGARLRGLQRRGEFEAVRGNNAVVVVGGRDQCRPILHAGVHVVQRRIGVKRLEI